jgi:hypothetical protein
MRNTKLGRAVTPAVAAFVLGAAVLFAGPGGRRGEALRRASPIPPPYRNT